ncbi:hypothetical protein Q5H92_26525 [Hymenobacter sp. M29]|uniref:Uncharacterized protein n=1 Tax=Hymenobacter mellowenesis TaxID=3063995 RepID=A0ABT9AJA1_9BACT|nr:hypothetical protein [Hymenobacter sp. M29]MDO7849943.1 hypothetical protein [Hymenobacter sp. M29]
MPRFLMVSYLQEKTGPAVERETFPPMRPNPPIRYYRVVERLLNRRITLCRDEPDGGYHLVFEICLSRQDAAEHDASQAADGRATVALRGGRILVTRLALTNEAIGVLSRLYLHHEKCAAERQKERNRRQQLIASRLAALEEAALNAELRTSEPNPPTTPTPPAAKPLRKPYTRRK